MLRYSPKHMPASTDGEATLFKETATPYRVLAVTTTGCFAVRNDRGVVRIFKWFYTSKDKEPVMIDPSRFLVIWSCRAPWNAEPCGEITRLHCGGCDLTALDVRSLARLRHLHCERNGLTGLDCSGMTELQVIDCRENELTSIDVEACHALKRILTFGNENLRPSEQQLLKSARGEGSVLPAATLMGTSLFDV
jgi:hypothetical protein